MSVRELRCEVSCGEMCLRSTICSKNER